MAFDLSTAKPVEEAPRARFDISTTKPVEEAAPPERGTLAEIGRQFGLTARAAVQGVTAPVNAIGDAVGLKSSATIRNALTKLGLPDAENATERVAQDVAGGMAGAGGMVGLSRGMANAGNALVQRIGAFLAENPGTQVVSGATGPGAASVVRESGGGPGAQMAAGMAGAMLPSVAATAAAASTRGVLRGGEQGRRTVESNLKTFDEAGIGGRINGENMGPSVGQASESRLSRAIESALAKTPGAAGTMARRAEVEAAGMASKVDEIAGALSSRTGAEPAGRAIKTGIGQFVDDFKAKAGANYDKLDKFLPAGSQVNVGKTQAALDALTADISGAPELSKFFQNGTIKAIKEAFESDTSGAFRGPGTAPKGTLPYEAVKKLRTLVGDEMATTNLVSDVPRSKWKALYAALSDDMGAAATAAGPQAEKALRRANRFYEAGLSRIDDVLSPIASKADPEKVFLAATAGTKEGATTIRAVMKGLPQESRDVLAATMLKRLGKATPGQQDALGEVFSPETFLTNWNRISPGAREVLFSNMPFGMRRDLNSIAKVAENIREGSKVFANPSGTGQVVGLHAPLYAALGLTAAGQVGAAGAVAVAPVAANAAARLMTNKDFVRWLAKTTKMPSEQVPAQINNLFQLSMSKSRAERRDVNDYIRSVREAGRPADSQQSQE